MAEDARLKALVAAAADSVAAIDELLFIVRNLCGASEATASSAATQQLLEDLARRTAQPVPPEQAPRDAPPAGGPG